MRQPRPTTAILVALLLFMAAGAMMHPASRVSLIAVASRMGLPLAQRTVDNDDVVHVLIQQPWPPAVLTAAQYDKRRRGRPLSIAGVDMANGPGIPLFQAHRERTDAGEVVVPLLTDVLLRATIPRSLVNQLPLEWRARVFENVVITLRLPTLSRDSAIGTAADVAERLDLEGLRNAGMTGKNVLIGIVDNGINIDILKQQHLARLPACSDSPPCFSFDEGLSSGSTEAGTSPANGGFTHGGMVAFDAMIAAPEITLADVVLSSGGTARVGDAIDAYVTLALKHFLRKLDDKPVYSGVVLVNSWGILNPIKDDPNSVYVANPNHVFQYVINSLADVGIDFVFAAGNCGLGGIKADCGTLGRTIYGANGYQRVLSVAAADVDGNYLTYSSQGPGWLFANKPDVTGFAEFAGFDAVDSGTSAAAPTVAGLIAAYRSKHPFHLAKPHTSVDAMRERIIRSVGNCIGTGTKPPYDENVGSGIVNGRCLVLEDAVDSSGPKIPGT